MRKIETGIMYGKQEQGEYVINKNRESVKEKGTGRVCST